MSLQPRTSRAIFCGAVLAAAANATCQCPDGVRSFLRYDGVWTMEVHSAGSNGENKSSRTRIENHCHVDGSFATCFQTVDKKSKMLVVYKPTEKPCEFTSTQIAEGASAALAGIVQIDGDVWTYPWTTEVNGRLVNYRVRNLFSGPDVIRFEKSLSKNSQAWILIQAGTEHRLAIRVHDK